METFPKGTTLDTTNIQLGELIHMHLAVYDVTYIRGLTSILTGLCENTRIIWVFLTASKRVPVSIIRFILTTLENEQHPCKHVRVDEDGALSKSTDITSLLIDDFNISVETSDGSKSWLNGKNERHSRIIHNMVR